MTDKKVELMLTLLVLASPFITVLIGWASTKAAQLLGVKVKNEKMLGVLTRANDTMWTLMLNAEQTLVREIKAAKEKESDGGEGITEAEGERIKNSVLAEFKKLYGPKGLEELMSVMGLETPELLTDWLGKKLESAVATKKLMGGTPDLTAIGNVLNFKQRGG